MNQEGTKYTYRSAGSTHCAWIMNHDRPIHQRRLTKVEMSEHQTEQVEREVARGSQWVGRAVGMSLYVDDRIGLLLVSSTVQLAESWAQFEDPVMDAAGGEE